MHAVISFLLRHGYLIVFVWVLAEQIGIPIPALPVLLAVGALAGTGQMSFTLALALAVIASLSSDVIWYWLGKTRGRSILNFLCRVSLEPDSCVRETENLFVRWGAKALLVAKFIPGFSTAAPPMAGMFRLPFLRFTAWDGAGALLWAGTFMTLGFLFRSQLEEVASYAAGMGQWLFVILGACLAAYIGWKYAQPKRFLRKLRIARITPGELRQKLEAGEQVVIVDLRHAHDLEAGFKLPGAIHVPPGDLESRHDEIPRDRDVVLYCT